MLVTKLFVSFQGYDPFFAFSSLSSHSLHSLSIFLSLSFFFFFYILKMWLMKYWKERKVTPHWLVTIGWTIYFVLLIIPLLSSFLFTKIDTIFISFLFHFYPFWFFCFINFSRESFPSLSLYVYIWFKGFIESFSQKILFPTRPRKLQHSSFLFLFFFDWNNNRMNQNLYSILST